MVSKSIMIRRALRIFLAIIAVSISAVVIIYTFSTYRISRSKIDDIDTFLFELQTLKTDHQKYISETYGALNRVSGTSKKIKERQSAISKALNADNMAKNRRRFAEKLKAEPLEALANNYTSLTKEVHGQLEIQQGELNNIKSELENDLNEQEIEKYLEHENDLREFCKKQKNQLKRFFPICQFFGIGTKHEQLKELKDKLKLLSERTEIGKKKLQEDTIDTLISRADRGLFALEETRHRLSKLLLDESEILRMQTKMNEEYNTLYKKFEDNKRQSNKIAKDGNDVFQVYININIREIFNALTPSLNAIDMAKLRKNAVVIEKALDEFRIQATSTRETVSNLDSSLQGMRTSLNSFSSNKNDERTLERESGKFENEIPILEQGLNEFDTKIAQLNRISETYAETSRKIRSFNEKIHSYISSVDRQLNGDLMAIQKEILKTLQIGNTEKVFSEIIALSILTKKFDKAFSELSKNEKELNANEIEYIGESKNELKTLNDELNPKVEILGKVRKILKNKCEYAKVDISTENIAKKQKLKNDYNDVLKKFKELKLDSQDNLELVSYQKNTIYTIADNLSDIMRRIEDTANEKKRIEELERLKSSAIEHDYPKRAYKYNELKRCYKNTHKSGILVSLYPKEKDVANLEIYTFHRKKLIKPICKFLLTDKYPDELNLLKPDVQYVFIFDFHLNFEYGGLYDITTIGLLPFVKTLLIGESISPSFIDTRTGRYDGSIIGQGTSSDFRRTNRKFGVIARFRNSTEYSGFLTDIIQSFLKRKTFNILEQTHDE